LCERNGQPIFLSFPFADLKNLSVTVNSSDRGVGVNALDEPSGEDVSMVTFSFESLLLTSSMKSIAQLVLNWRPLSKLTL